MSRCLTFACLILGLASGTFAADLSYPIVGTGQSRCYDNRREIAPPKPGEPFFGQDAEFPGLKPAYRDNGDGTVHGAGAQRSDPKQGAPAAFPRGRGPQGDVVRIFNYVRCVCGPTAK